MPKYYACNANIPGGEPIEPINRKRVKQGRFYVPDCPDYESKFGLRVKIKLSEAYAGWSCWNCTHLMESSDPFEERKHTSYTAQRPGKTEETTVANKTDAAAKDTPTKDVPKQDTPKKNSDPVPEDEATEDAEAETDMFPADTA